MKTYIKSLILTGVAGVLLAPTLQAASVSIVTVGGNASINLVQDRLTNLLSGITLTLNSTNKLIFRAVGNWGSTNVQWDFNLTGGAAAVLDIASQNHVRLQDNTTAIPVNAISITAPETVGIDSTPFQHDFTLVAPLVYVKNANTSGTNDLAGITNLTQRLAYKLEESNGHLPTSFFGGSNTNTPLYFIGRNGSAAVRQVFDANIFFTATAFSFTTNSLGQPIPYVGASSGSEVASIVKVIPNSIGTVAAQDIGGLPTLTYEGVPFSTANVINGSYPIWGYERYIYYPTGSKAPLQAQLSLIQALEAAVSDPTYDHTSSLFVNKFVSYADVNASVYRDPTVDGSVIESSIY